MHTCERKYLLTLKYYIIDYQLSIINNLLKIMAYIKKFM
jgi:hypothetical protein